MKMKSFWKNTVSYWPMYIHIAKGLPFFGLLSCFNAWHSVSSLCSSREIQFFRFSYLSKFVSSKSSTLAGTDHTRQINKITWTYSPQYALCLLAIL